MSCLSGDAEALYIAVDRHRPDVAVADIRMPPTGTNEGLVAADRLAHSHPEVGVLVLSQHLELQYALQLVEGRAGRRGYLLKDRIADIEGLVDAIRRIARGGCVIDPMIAERLVDRAKSAGQIFLKLGLRGETRDDRRVAAVLTYLRAMSAG